MAGAQSADIMPLQSFVHQLRRAILKVLRQSQRCFVGASFGFANSEKHRTNENRTLYYDCPAFQIRAQFSDKLGTPH
jgi:hypothetical protein